MLPRIRRYLGWPDISARTLYRRVRLVAVWRRPKLAARGDPDHDHAVAQILARLLELPRRAVVLLLRAFPAAPVLVVICDNDSIHQARKVAAYLEEHPRIELLYGARYSPHDNPAERIWGALKNYMANTAVSWPGRLRQIRAFFRARSPDQMPATAAPWTSPWLPPGYEQNFGMPLGYLMSTAASRGSGGGGCCALAGGCGAGGPILVTVPGDAFLADWCDRYLGARPARVLLRSGYLSQVVGAELTDGRRVAVKARLAAARIAGCVAVQGTWLAGDSPVPSRSLPRCRPEGSPSRLRSWCRAAASCRPEAAAAPFAALLGRLVSSAPGPAAVPSLAPSPPWTGWDHPGSRLWPDRDDRGRDLNSTPGPAWISDAARRVRERLSASAAAARVGHGDWEPQNIAWSAGRPLAVHDWDSVIAQPETAIADLAAAVWPAAGAPGEAATVAQNAELIAGYQHAAGRRWTGQEVQGAWAAGLWVRLFDAKKDAADRSSTASPAR